jgi:hypothetical protein
MKRTLFLIVLMIALPFVGAQAGAALTEHQTNVFNAYFQTFFPGFGTAFGLLLDGPGIYTWPAADGTVGQVLQTNGAGTLSWTGAATATKWNAIGNPDGNYTQTQGAHTTTFNATTGGWVWNFTGNYSTTRMLIEQKTGNPTGGSLVELKVADADSPFLTCTNSGTKFSVSSAGNTVVAGTLATTGASTFTGEVTTTDVKNTIIRDRTNTDVYIGTTKTLVKTVGLDSSGEDYELPNEANTNRYDLELTNLLPAYAELVSIQIRCTEAVEDAGAQTMTIRIGTGANGEQILADVTPDTLNEISQSSTGLAASNAARTMYVAFTPGANWSTLTAGTYVLAFTYIDYGAVYTHKLQ